MTTFVAALIASAVLVGVATAALQRFGVMDVPNERSSHQRPVPRGGGIALVPSMVIAISASSTWTPVVSWIVAGAVALGLVGLVDDIRNVSALTRLGLQFFVTVAVGSGLVRTLIAPSPILLLVTIAGAAVWLTGFVNVYNFMDGANGVAGLHAAVAGGWFAYVGAREDVASLTVGGLALLGVAMGFVPWNFPRAWVFLGDVGSYSVGVVLGSLGVVTLLSTHSVLLAVAPLCVFLADTTLTLVRRARAGRPVMTAHREHVYQRITTLPGSPWPAVATTSTSLACVAAAGVTIPPVCLVCWCFIVGAYVSLPRIAKRRSVARTR